MVDELTISLTTYQPQAKQKGSWRGRQDRSKTVSQMGLDFKGSRGGSFYVSHSPRSPKPNAFLTAQHFHFHDHAATRLAKKIGGHFGLIKRNIPLQLVLCIGNGLCSKPQTKRQLYKNIYCAEMKWSFFRSLSSLYKHPFGMR